MQAPRAERGCSKKQNLAKFSKIQQNLAKLQLLQLSCPQERSQWESLDLTTGSIEEKQISHTQRMEIQQHLAPQR